MKSNISNLNSIDLVSISNRDLNLQSNMKVSQRLDSRLKSVMPELKGKISQIYLTIKAHSSFEDSRTHLIKQIKEQLQIHPSGQLNLSSYISWSTFQQTKQLLKDEYLDNQLYYLIVPDKHLSWGETFARQQRTDSDNKKKIHVLGIIKDNLYKQKIKAQAKKRYDKIPDYIHYFSLDSLDCSRDIFTLISGHLEQKLKHQDQHIKTWALSNKYADKKIQRKTIHIYFDQADKETLDNLYRKYNPRSRSSWLQIHPYGSFYDIVKSIKQREILNNKQADKAQQMTQQITSRLLQSRSQLELGSMKSLVLLDNSQLISSSIQSVSKLNKDDINIIITRTDFRELDKLKAFVKAQKIKNWDLIQINTDSPNFYHKMAEIFDVGKNFQKQFQMQKQKKIINSKTLYIIAEINDEFTKRIFQRQDNIFHNMELLLYSNATDFALLLRQGVKSKDNYTVSVIPGGVNTVDYQFEKEIKEFMKQYKNTQAIENFTFLSSANGHHASLISSSFQNDMSQSRVYHLANNQDNWLENIMLERDNFFHPFKGLKGSNVYILVKSSREYLLKEIRDYISHSRRLHLGTYIDKEYLTKQLETIQIKDSAIVITDDECLREAQEVLVKFDEAFIMNVTNRKNLKEEVKVFAWGEKQVIYDLLKQIPELDEKFESETYIQVANKVSLQRKNRFLPKKIDFIPGNTIVMRLPAQLTDEQSRKMQVRLKRYFKQQIKFQYYKDPSDIRLRMKQIQPLTFNILREKQLQYMKAFARKSIQEKREEFILYHPNPGQYKYLIQKPEFERFRFLSNSWPDIQDYIIRTYNIYVKPDIKETIYDDELVHVFVDKLPCEISEIVARSVDATQLKAANNTLFYLKNNLEEVLLIYGQNHKFYYVLEEAFNQNDSLEKQNQAKKALSISLSIDENKKLEFIHLGINRGQFKNSPFTIKCYQQNNKSTAEWINSIKVLKSQPLVSRPYILIDKTSADWYYFLSKQSNLTNRFKFVYTKSRDDMRKTIEKIRNKQPAEQIWILVKNITEANQSLKIAQKIQIGRNISILAHAAQSIRSQDQKKKIIFAHADRLQVQKFILNPFRRSQYQFFPSSVNNKKVILAPINSKSKSFQTIPLNQQQINNWQKNLNAQIIYCSDIHNLQLMQLQNSDSTIYAILDAQIEEKNRKKLQTMQNVKRIILNNNYNTRQLRNNFRVSNKEIYEASYPAQINTYLRYLRYNIKNPETEITKKYQKQLTEVYTLTSTQIKDKATMDYIHKKNDSLLKYKVFRSDELKDVLDSAALYDYNVVFVGDSIVGQAVNERNKKTNTKFKFINSADISNLNNNSQFSTTQTDEVKMYIYNMPETRYNHVKNANGKFRFLYDTKNQSAEYLQIVEQAKKASLRNNAIEAQGFDDINKLNNSIKDQSFLLIEGKYQQNYQNLLKKNNNVQYLISNNDPSKYLASYGNKYFINRKKEQFTSFFNNLQENYRGTVQPIPLMIDTSIANILRSVENLKSESLITQKYFNLTMNPPFQTENLEVPMIKEILKVSANLLDKNPPSLLNVPMAMPAKPIESLGLKWIEKIKQAKINNLTIKPLIAPALDYSPPPIKISSQPDRNFPVLSVAPTFPTEKVKRFHLAVLFLQINEFRNLGQMIKSNLQPQQFTVKLISFRNQHQLDEYSKGNASRLNSYDKIIVLLTPEYKKYQQILKTMKSKLQPRMEYFIFDQNFHQKNHKLLAAHLKPYKIRKIKLPYENPNLPAFWHQTKKFNIFVPFGNSKFQNLRNENVQIVPYNSKQTVMKDLHKYGEFNIIVCDKNTYHEFKDLVKISPRSILLVDDTADLFEDELLFNKVPENAVYYGPNGNQFIRTHLKFNNKPPASLKMLYFFKNDQQSAKTYDGYEKVQRKNYLQVLESTLTNNKQHYNHWLLKNSPVPEIIALQPKVYMENQEYMKDYKNNFLEVGYKHKNDELNMIRSQIKAHEFSDLQQIYYKNHKHLATLLQNESSPCIILINGSNNRMLQTRHKFNGRHRFISIVNDHERWIDRDGYLLQVEDYKLRRKQDMFLGLFNQKIFEAFNDFQYYYLSNKADEDHRKNIYFRTKEDLEQIYRNNTHLLMVVFVESSDRKHIPDRILEQSNRENGRVKIIYLRPEFHENDTDLYIKFNEIDPVIIHINRVQIAGRKDYIIFKQIDGDKKRRAIIMQRLMQNVESKPYNSMDDIQTISQAIKGQYKKVHVICYPSEQQQIEKILQKFSIKNRQNSTDIVEYLYIDQVSTIHGLLSNTKQSYIQENQVSPIKDSNGGVFKEQMDQLLLASQMTKNINNRRSRVTPDYQSESSVDVVQYAQEFQTKSTPKANPTTLNQQKIQKIKAKKDLTIYVSEKLKSKLPLKHPDTNSFKYFRDPALLSNKKYGSPQLIISNQNYEDLTEQSNIMPETFFIYVNNNKIPLIESNYKNENALIMTEEQVQAFLNDLQIFNNKALTKNNNNNNDEMENFSDSDRDSKLKKSLIQDYQKVRIVYDANLSPEQKRKILSTLYKYKSISPIKFENMEKLSEMMKEPNSLVMLMMDKQLPGLDKTVNIRNYKVVKHKNRKMRMILPNRKKSNGFETLDTIFQEHNENENEFTLIVKDLSDEQVDLVLGLIQKKPEDRQTLLDMQKSKIRKDDIIDYDQITKLNVHSNIRVEDIKLLANEQIAKIKQRLDGNFIVLVVEPSKKEEVKEITDKYNVLLQIYTNALNLENGLRDRKDSVTIAVINKKMIDKVVPLKQKYKQATFILEDDTPQQQLLNTYKPYISGQIRKMGDLQKIIAELYSQNQKIRYNDHTMKQASRQQSKRPIVSVVDFSNNERFANAVQNQVSKRAFLFYQDPENVHVKTRLINDVGEFINFIPYKNVANLKAVLERYNNHSSIVIANGEEIPEIQSLISKKKQNVFLIRFNTPEDTKDVAKVKRLFSTYKKSDLEDYLFTEFMKIANHSKHERDEYRSKSPPQQNIEIKKYTQKYQPTAFGTTPRFAADFVPPKSMKQTYSNKYMKSQSRSKVFKDESSKSRNIYQS